MPTKNKRQGNFLFFFFSFSHFTLDHLCSLFTRFFPVISLQQSPEKNLLFSPLCFFSFFLENSFFFLFLLQKNIRMFWNILQSSIKFSNNVKRNQKNRLNIPKTSKTIRIIFLNFSKFFFVFKKKLFKKYFLKKKIKGFLREFLSEISMKNIFCFPRNFFFRKKKVKIEKKQKHFLPIEILKISKIDLIIIIDNSFE